MMGPIADFFQKYADTDIFCLQEVYDNATGKDLTWTNGTNFNFFEDSKKLLPLYHSYYRPHLGDWWGLALFVKKGTIIHEEGDFFVHKHKNWNMSVELLGHTAKNIQFLKTEVNGKPVAVMNIHGLWNGKGKTDTDERITQSKNIVDFIRSLDMDFVFCGDFNLLPETESIKMIERELDCRNLITEYKVSSTRTSQYKKSVRFADYAFISKGVNLVDFKVLPDEISDHAPLFIEIS